MGTADMTDAQFLPKPGKRLPQHDDIWNEQTTLALLQAWGRKFLEQHQGSLSRKDWLDITDHVSMHSKTPKTETQCRNRIDTLKKKYKREKHANGSASNWIYFKHMDSLLSITKPKSAVTEAIAVQKSPLQNARTVFPTSTAGRVSAHHEQFTGRITAQHEQFTDRITGQHEQFTVRVNTHHEQDTGRVNGYHEKDMVAPAASGSCDLGESSAMSESSPDLSYGEDHECRKKKAKLDTAPIWLMAKALENMTSVYEKIETAKQKHALDLEKTRMEVTRNFEIQKWKLLLQTQVELAKIADVDHMPFDSDMSAKLFATCFMPLEYCL